eukprot:1863421-Rhodomonas_salina.2
MLLPARSHVAGGAFYYRAAPAQEPGTPLRVAHSNWCLHTSVAHCLEGFAHHVLPYRTRAHRCVYARLQWVSSLVVAHGVCTRVCPGRRC